jgi:hypothetical protein
MQKDKYKRCPICGQWLREHERLFCILICACGYKESGRMNSVVEPAKEKRGFVASAWDKIGGR